MCKSRKPISTKAFTLTELAAVLGVICVLAGLAIPVVSTARKSAISARCLANIHQFSLAFDLYCNDNNDVVLPNLDGKDVALGLTWVQGWLGLPGPDVTNTAYLRQSLIAPYVREVSIWACPGAPIVEIGPFRQRRSRTISLNCFLGSPIKSPDVVTFSKLTDLNALSPADALSFLEERADTINDASFAMQWDFDIRKPSLWILRDKPNSLHINKGNLGFVDGHCESHKWLDAGVTAPSRDDFVVPFSADILWLQEHATARLHHKTLENNIGTTLPVEK